MSTPPRNLLYVSPTPFLPSDAGSRARIHNLIQALGATGLDVHFLHVTRTHGDPEAMRHALGADRFRSIPFVLPPRRETRLQRVTRHLRQLVDEDARHTWGIDDWYDDSITAAALDWLNSKEFSVLIITYVFFSRLFDFVPDSVFKIIDTQDRFSLRHRLYLSEGIKPGFFSTTPSEEARGLSRADLILTIEEAEAHAFRSQTAKPVHTIGHLLCIEDCLRERQAGQPLQLLIIGSDNDINIHGLNAFLLEDWPAIKERIPQARVLVAGSLSKHAPASRSIIPLGRVPDIADAYRQADIVINPVRSGTGLCIKTIEALGFGMPLVTTTAGSRGLEDGAGSAFLVAETPEDTADAVCNLWRDERSTREISTAAVAYAKRYNQRAMTALPDLIQSNRGPSDPECSPVGGIDGR